MVLNKTPTQRKFENAVQRECDKLDDLRTDKLVISFIVFIIACVLYSIFS